MEKNKTVIWYLLLSIIVFISECLVGFLPSIISFLAFGLIYLFNIVLFLVFFVILLSSLKLLKHDKKQVIINSLCVIISFITIFFSYGVYNLTHNYSLVNNYLKEKFGSSYHIKGLSDKKDLFKSNYKCDYYFEVYLDDSTDIVFEAGYCLTSSSAFPSYDVVINYGDYYIKYFYDNYKKHNSASFKFEKKDDNLVISYNENNVKEVYDFMEYIKGKLVYNHITVEFYNETTGKSDYYNFWNEFTYLYY